MDGAALPVYPEPDVPYSFPIGRDIMRTPPEMIAHFDAPGVIPMNRFKSIEKPHETVWGWRRPNDPDIQRWVVYCLRGDVIQFVKSRPGRQSDL